MRRQYYLVTVTSVVYLSVPLPGALSAQSLPSLSSVLTMPASIVAAVACPLTFFARKLEWPLHAKTPFKRKLSQQQDGDLWEQMHESIQSSGHSSIRAKKVRGHATAAMIEVGIVNPQDKDDNDWADEAAGKGTDKDSKLATVARKYSLRNARYRIFMAKVHTFSIKMLKAHKEEIEIQRKP